MDYLCHVLPPPPSTVPEASPKKLLHVPPQYSDLGKQARDLLSKHYHFGLIKVEFRAKDRKCANYTFQGIHHIDRNRACCFLELKRPLGKVNVTGKINTDKVISTEFALNEGFYHRLPGFKASLDTTFPLQSGGKTGTLATAFKANYVNVNNDVHISAAGPVIHSSGVLGYCGWLAGCQLCYDISKGQLLKGNFSIEHRAPQYAIHANINNGQELEGSFYWKVNKYLEGGIQLGWTNNIIATPFSIGWKYTHDSSTSFGLKINQSKQLGLGYTQKLLEGVTITASAMVDTSNFNQGRHKLGLFVDLEA